MAQFGTGLAALAGTSKINPALAYRKFSSFKPKNWALVEVYKGYRPGWYGVHTNVLADSLKIVANSGAKMVTVEDLVTHTLPHAKLVPVVSPIIGRTYKVPSLLRYGAKRLDLSINLLKHHGIPLSMSLEEAIPLIEGLDLDMDEKHHLVRLFRRKSLKELFQGTPAALPGKQFIMKSTSDLTRLVIGDPTHGLGVDGKVILKSLMSGGPGKSITLSDSGLAASPGGSGRGGRRGGGGRGGGGGAGGGGGPPNFYPNPRPKGDPASAEVVAYPQFDVQPRHVVGGEKLLVNVSLGFRQDPEVSGESRLPPGKHEIDVHLLLETETAWGRLTFDSESGHADPASVEMTAPVLGPDDNGQVPPRRILPLIANFYLNGRWCGEGRYHVEILSGADVAKTPHLGVPLSPWPNTLRLAPGSVPPDLLVRIQPAGGNGYKFTLVSPHMRFTETREDKATITSEGHLFVKQHLNGLAGGKLSQKEKNRVHAKLQAIFDNTPKDFQRGYWTLLEAAQRAARRGLPAPKLETIQFVSNEPYIPWDLMLTRPEDPPKKGQHEEILAIAHAVGRWSPQSHSQLRSSLHVTQLAVFAFDYKGQPNEIAWAAAEAQFLSEKPYWAQVGELKSRPLGRFLRQGGAQVIHFSCHGEMDVQQPGEAAILLKDEEKFGGDQIDLPAVRKGMRRNRPLVFLNACQVGALGQVIAIPTNLPQAFLNAGATACIAPLWNVADPTAKDVAEQFYELVFNQNFSLGEALQTIRARWKKESNLTYLSYALYGDPATTVTWQRREAEPA